MYVVYLSISSFEEEHSQFTKSEIDEVSRLMRDIGAEISSNNTVPGCGVARIKGTLDMFSHVFFILILRDGFFGYSHGFLLHFLRHISVQNFHIKLGLRKQKILKI